MSAQLRLLASVMQLVPIGPAVIDRLYADPQLRRLCGWSHIRALPHESKFSRAFALFAESQLPQQLHAAVIKTTQGGRLVGHIARDSTAIEARERNRRGWRHGALGSGSGEFQAGIRRRRPGFLGGGGGGSSFGVFG